MKVLLDIPENILEILGQLADIQKRSRKSFLELILILHAETADVPRGTSTNETTESQNKAVADPLTLIDIQNHRPDKKTRNLPQKNEPTVNMGVNNDAEIERLTKAMNSCSDTSLGRKAKVHYQRQIDNLKK